MKGKKKNRSKVVLIRDRLYVNYKLGDPDESREPHQSKTRPNRRHRVNSTPENIIHLITTDMI